MKQGQVMKAYVSLRDLNQQKLSSGKLAKNIFDLMTTLQKSYDFQVQEEQKICDAHPRYDPSLRGIPINGDTEHRDEIIQEVKSIDKEFKDLSELEVDVEFKPFDFDLEKENVSLSGEDIGNLSPFINFI